ncbi:hypothetical protein CC86DRAFT_290743 [Ophiobolus disseminans]|uniref:Uncharacterized protein n=1 Tax=Ophiobolus disseminans TaxID=1469910 RepID=A0A6A7A419_9PLEO|nr:hypothetical protein CC86DRAFT_290743 [Ophiobolus disseminans]
MPSRDPNGPGSGRTSRASDMSSVSRMTNKYPGDAGGGGGGNPRHDLLSSAGPGIQSMLRTSTEMGNVVGLNGDLSGHGNAGRYPHRYGASSRLSIGSTVSNQSNFTYRNHRQHPSSSSAPRGSMQREPLPLANVPFIDTLSPATMNTAGSSSLAPNRGRDRDRDQDQDSQRSMSMTHSMPPQPPLRLSNMRSMGSLRGHDAHYRSNSPLPYPGRFAPQGHRAASPAWNNVPGQNPRRMQTYGGRGQPYTSGGGYSAGGPRPGNSVPSDASLANSERSHAIPRRKQSHRAMYVDDVPPLPPLEDRYYPWIEQDRMMNNHLMASGSSSSFNVRTDSDTPSSDLPLPLTPRDNMPTDAYGGYPNNQTRLGARTRATNEAVSSGPLYYDGSEQFEHEQYVNPEQHPIVTGFVAHLKTVPERTKSDSGPPYPAWKKGDPYITPPRIKHRSRGKVSLEAKGARVPHVAELPASPVVRRITRELVKEGLGPASTTGDVGSSLNSPDFQGNPAAIRSNRHPVTTGPIESETTDSYTLPTQMDNRRSTLSQVGSSVLDSETVDLARNTYIPALTGTIPFDELATEPEPVSASLESARKSTGDGMTELLEGYQHTDAKQEQENGLIDEAVQESNVPADTHSEAKPNYAQTSSDEQSFKSCTDVPEPVSPASPDMGKDKGGRSSKAATDNDDPRPVKEFDARPFPSDKGITTPGRSSSRVPSRLPSTSVAGVEPRTRTPDRPSSSPLRSFIRKGKALPREASRSFTASKLRRSSKPSMKQGSVSISGSSSTLGAAQQPHPVPPRESSASKEAQRQRGVGTFLMRFRRGKKMILEESVSVKDSVENLSSEPVVQDEDPIERDSPLPQGQDGLNTPEKAAVTPELVPKEQKSTPSLEFSSPSLQDNTTTNLRLSEYKYSYPPQRYLPDVKEDSHEDSSLNTSASNLKNSRFRFPLGGGRSIRLSFDFDDSLVPSRRSSTRSHRRSVFGDAKGLPRIEFSQPNLLEKFKDALGDMRFSRSLDLPDHEKDLLQRSVSAGHVHEYTPHFVNLNEVEHLRNSKGMIAFARLKHACPPGLMREIERLSIPSVTQLTQRFSEMLPSLSLGEYYTQREHGGASETADSVSAEFPEEQEIMEHALESIHEVHPPSQKRSSARLRPMRGSSALMVVDDDVFEELTSKEKERGGASAGGQVAEAPASGAGEAGTRVKGKSKVGPQTPTRQLSPIAELQPPSPAALRPRSYTAGNHHLRTSAETALSSRRSLRSFASTPTATVTSPWNFDENYPWATTTDPAVNISLHPPNAAKSSPRPGPSHLRNALSDATSSTFTASRTTTVSPAGNASSYNPNRPSHRLSIFGRSGDQAHAVGERYPTSALSPPTAIFRDNLSSCDISDDEDFISSRKTRLSLRKRFSSAARNSTILHTPPRVTRSKANPAELASPASAHENSSSTLQDRASEADAFTRTNRATYGAAEGMRPGLFRRQRLIKRFRKLLNKGTNLLDKAANLARKLTRTRR